MKKYCFFGLIFCFFASSLYSKPLAIIMIGPPGSGKGTQSQLIQKEFHFTHISTGDLLRENIYNQSFLGNQVANYLKEGKLVPDDFILDILWKRISDKDCLNGIIIDGSSRNEYQANQLFKHLNELYHLIIIILQVPDNTIIERLKYRLICKNCHVIYHLKSSPPLIEGKCNYCNQDLFLREDDSEKIVLERLKIYHMEFKILKKFYKHKQHVFYIDGNRSIDNIFQDINLLLRNFQSNS